jgi:hypothetical protein
MKIRECPIRRTQPMAEQCALQSRILTCVTQLCATLPIPGITSTDHAQQTSRHHRQIQPLLLLLLPRQPLFSCSRAAPGS